MAQEECSQEHQKSQFRRFTTRIKNKFGKCERNL